MPDDSPLRVVIDTNVVFEGLTNHKSVCSLVIEAWRVGFIDVYVSNALAYEYLDVFARKLSPRRDDLRYDYHKLCTMNWNVAPTLKAFL